MSRRSVREVLRRRGTRLGASDVGYRIYIAVMLTIILIAPVVRAGLIWAQDALPSVGAGSAPGPAGAWGSSSLLAPCLTAATALLVLAGSRIGPARAGLPQLDLLFTAPLPRRRLLGGPIARWTAVGAAVGVLAAAVVVAGRALRGELDAGLATALPLAGASLGVLAVAALFVGQIGRRARALAIAPLAALASAQWALGPGALPDPWSCAARLLVDGEASPVGAVVPVLAAVAAAGGTAWGAARLRWEDLRGQALRWDAVQTLVIAGDPAAGLARLGAPVRWGRRLRLRPGRGLTGAILLRDLLGIVRTPGRSLLGLGGMLVSGLLWGASVTAIPPVSSGGLDAPDGRFLLPFVGAGLLGAGAMLIAYLAGSAWCRGLAAAAQGSGSPPLLPSSPVGLVARHLVAPAVLSAVALALGAACWSSWGGGAAGAWIPVSAACAAAVAVGMRALTALKGAIPLRLLAPVPTPAGDMAGVNVLIWTLDGPLNSLFAGAGLGIVWALALAGGLAPLAAILVSLAVLGAVLLWARARLGRPAP